MKKRMLCLILSLTMAVSQTVVVSASSKKVQLQQEKAQTQSQLSAQQSKIDELEDKKYALSQEINALDADLVNLLMEMDIHYSESLVRTIESIISKI